MLDPLLSRRFVGGGGGRIQEIMNHGRVLEEAAYAFHRDRRANAWLVIRAVCFRFFFFFVNVIRHRFPFCRSRSFRSRLSRVPLFRQPLHGRLRLRRFLRGSLLCPWLRASFSGSQMEFRQQLVPDLQQVFTDLSLAIDQVLAKPGHEMDTDLM